MSASILFFSNPHLLPEVCQKWNINQQIYFSFTSG